MQIRDANAARDAAACAAIYAPFVTGSGVSFEERAPTPDELAERIARTAASYARIATRCAARRVSWSKASV
jgi:L-amino acid N-acyltransferase YncA